MSIDKDADELTLSILPHIRQSINTHAGTNGHIQTHTLALPGSLPGTVTRVD